jgi:hypothetical protein
VTASIQNILTLPAPDCSEVVQSGNSVGVHDNKTLTCYVAEENVSISAPAFCSVPPKEIPKSNNDASSSGAAKLFSEQPVLPAIDYSLQRSPNILTPGGVALAAAQFASGNPELQKVAVEALKDSSALNASFLPTPENEVFIAAQNLSTQDPDKVAQGKLALAYMEKTDPVAYARVETIFENLVKMGGVLAAAAAERLAEKAGPSTGTYETSDGPAVDPASDKIDGETDSKRQEVIFKNYFPKESTDLRPLERSVILSGSSSPVFDRPVSSFLSTSSMGEPSSSEPIAFFPTLQIPLTEPAIVRIGNSENGTTTFILPSPIEKTLALFLQPAAAVVEARPAILALRQEIARAIAFIGIHPVSSSSSPDIRQVPILTLNYHPAKGGIEIRKEIVDNAPRVPVLGMTVVNGPSESSSSAPKQKTGSSNKDYSAGDSTIVAFIPLPAAFFAALKKKEEKLSGPALAKADLSGTKKDQVKEISHEGNSDDSYGSHKENSDGHPSQEDQEDEAHQAFAAN